MNTAQLLAPWRAAWQQRSARERRLFVLATLVVGLAAVWQWALAPALSTWRSAPQQQSLLDAQTQQMLQLQAQAKTLQAPTRLSRADAVRQLEKSLPALQDKQARLSLQGDQLRLSMVATPASALASWLGQAREQAQALPLNAQLQRVNPSSDAAATDAEPLWRGELTLRLP